MGKIDSYMWRWLLLSAVVIISDLGSKSLASQLLVYRDPVPVLPFFNFTLLHNYGAAFSFLADQPGWQRWFFITLAVAVSAMLLRWLLSVPRSDKWLAIAIALVLGGAVGNLYDRITLGYVVDFLHFYWNDYHFPAFNIADSAITIGAIMMALDIFRNHEETASHQQNPQQDK